MTHEIHDEVKANYKHRGKSTYGVTLTFPDGTSFTDRVSVDSDRSRTAFLKKIRQAYPELELEELQKHLLVLAQNPPEEAKVEADALENASAATRCVALADEYEIFKAADRIETSVYASLDVDGHLETWSLNSQQFRGLLAARYYEVFEKVPGSQALADAINVMTGRALGSDNEHPVALRVAGTDEEIYLDLGDAKWQVVKITANGWEVIASRDCPHRFTRRRGTQALPVPERGGSLETLRRLLNLPDDDAWILFKTFLVACLRPNGPYPVLIIEGQQGSAKSWTCTVLVALLDPKTPALRRPPRNEQDLQIYARNGFVVCLNNLSGISGWLSDALCCLSTGGGFGARQLYTDGDEMLFDSIRPIVLNGIHAVANRADLLDRAIRIVQPSIPDDERREEAVLLGELEHERPKILGSLFDALASTIANYKAVKFERIPRMADFARWGMGSEQGLGIGEGGFMRAYEANRDDAQELAVELSVLGEPLSKLMGQHDGAWDGTATDLLSDLESAAFGDSKQRPRGWPKTTEALGKELRQLAPDLPAVGISVQFYRKAGGSRDRLITIARTGPDSDRDGNGTARDSTSEGPVPGESALAGSPGGSRDGWDSRDGDSPTSSIGETEVVTWRG